MTARIDRDLSSLPPAGFEAPLSILERQLILERLRLPLRQPFTGQTRPEAQDPTVSLETERKCSRYRW
jgi:hypothetical protein